MRWCPSNAHPNSEQPDVFACTIEPAGARRRGADAATREALRRAAADTPHLRELRSALLRDRTPDTGCGPKLIGRDTFLELPVFDHMHRFLPALVLADENTHLVASTSR